MQRPDNSNGDPVTPPPNDGKKPAKRSSWISPLAAWLFPTPSMNAPPALADVIKESHWDSDKLKPLCDSLERLWRQYFDNFARRQGYEWKMVVVLWTPIVLYVGYGLTGRLIPLSPVLAGIVSFGYLFVHYFWQLNLNWSNDGDIRALREVSEYTRQLSGLPSFAERFVNDGPKLRTPAWSHLTYLAVTCVLLVGANTVNIQAQTTRVVVPKGALAALNAKADRKSMSLDEYVGQHLRAVAERESIPRQDGQYSDGIQNTLDRVVRRLEDLAAVVAQEHDRVAPGPVPPEGAADAQQSEYDGTAGCDSAGNEDD